MIITSDRYESTLFVIYMYDIYIVCIYKYIYILLSSLPDWLGILFSTASRNIRGTPSLFIMFTFQLHILIVVRTLVFGSLPPPKVLYVMIPNSFQKSFDFCSWTEYILFICIVMSDDAGRLFTARGDGTNRSAIVHTGYINADNKQYFIFMRWARDCLSGWPI